MKRREILEAAADLVEGARQEQYGAWSDNAANVATIWSILLNTQVTARQVALCMVGLKLARLRHGPDADSWIDLAGYSGLGGEIDE